MSGVNVAADGLGIGGPKGADKILLNWALLRVPGCERYLPPEPRRAIPGRPLNGSVEAELDRRKCAY